MTKYDSSHNISEILIDAKNFDPSKLCLVNPNDIVFHIYRLVMIYYKRIFSKYAWKECIKETMTEAILNKMQQKTVWFLDGECKEHRLKHLDYLLRVLLFKNAQWLSQSIISSDLSRKRVNKLKKLNSSF